MSIDEKLEAVQAVVERVTSYQDGAMDRPAHSGEMRRTTASNLCNQPELY